MSKTKTSASPVFYEVLRQAGIVRPVPEFKFHPVRRWRIDFAWPDQHLALEVDGGVWIQGRHTRGSGYVKDMEKQNEMARLGWLLIKCQPADMCSDYTIGLIRDILKG